MYGAAGAGFKRKARGAASEKRVFGLKRRWRGAAGLRVRAEVLAVAARTLHSVTVDEWMDDAGKRALSIIGRRGAGRDQH
jgi:hypothetical protein